MDRNSCFQVFAFQIFPCILNLPRTERNLAVHAEVLLYLKIFFMTTLIVRNTHRPIPLVIGHASSEGAVHRDLQIVGSQAVSVSVGIRKKTTLQHSAQALTTTCQKRSLKWHTPIRFTLSNKREKNVAFMYLTYSKLCPK